jgi:hypothetical protein
MAIPFSILDLAPIVEGGTAVGALQTAWRTVLGVSLRYRSNKKAFDPTEHLQLARDEGSFLQAGIAAPPAETGRFHQSRKFTRRSVSSSPRSRAARGHR